MSIRDAIRAFRDGLSKGPMIPVSGGLGTVPVVNAGQHMIPVTPGLGSNIPVVNTMRPPTSSNVPATWSSIFMGPGQPFAGGLTGDSTRTKDAELEPRSMQYLPSVNSTITPRVSWGLMPFSDLRLYAETVPEVSMCVRLLTEELKSFIPTLVDADDKTVDKPDLKWMTERPDMYNPWPVWLSRFLYNTIVYDAPAVYKIRKEWAQSPRVMSKTYRHKPANRPVELTSLMYDDPERTSDAAYKWWCASCGGENYLYLSKSQRTPLEITYCEHCSTAMPRYAKTQLSSGATLTKSEGITPICGLRIIDGSTLFPLIDERGEQPEPPAPSFTQVIWGVPRMYLNTYQVWYRPRHLRADAPYGRSFIEDALPAVKLLQSLWDYEYQKYQVGNIPEMVFTCPPDWNKDAESILQYEEEFNSRMAGSTKERVRARFLPNGMATINTKELTFNEASYAAAFKTVRMAVGIPDSEASEAPEGMLGGKSYAEAMQSSFYRMGLAPLQAFIESLFNDILRENGYADIHFELKFPSDSMDPEKEESKWQGRFMNGIATRNEVRTGIGMNEIADKEKGEFMITPGGKPGDDQQGGAPGGPGGPDGGMPPGMGGGPAGGGKIPVSNTMKNPIPVAHGVKPIQLKQGGPKIPVFHGTKNIAVKLAKSAEEQNGIMVAFPIPAASAISAGISWPEGSDVLPEGDLHVTLAFLGDVTAADYGKDQLFRVVEEFAKTRPALTGKLNGVGRFLETHLDGMECLHMNYDCPGLPEFRQALVSYLNQCECPVKEDHGFTPHLTLAYIPKGQMPDTSSVAVMDAPVSVLRCAWGDEVHDYPLEGGAAPAPELEKEGEGGMAAPAAGQGFTTQNSPNGVYLLGTEDQDKSKKEDTDETERMDKAVAVQFPTLNLQKRGGVDPEDDEYFGAPVERAVDALMPHQGSNVSQIVAIGSDDQQKVPAVWKPVTGEKEDLKTWAGGDLYRRAEANYLLDRELGGDNHYLVPVTYVAESGAQPGSVQLYVKNFNLWKAANMYSPEWTEQAGVFDFIAGQMDRKRKNWLTHPDDTSRPIFIDNDISFNPGEDESLRSDWITVMQGKALSHDLLERVALVAGNRSLWQDIQETLSDKNAADRAQARAKLVAETGKIPVSPISETIDTEPDVEKVEIDMTAMLLAPDVPEEVTKVETVVESVPAPESGLVKLESVVGEIMQMEPDTQLVDAVKRTNDLLEKIAGAQPNITIHMPEQAAPVVNITNEVSVPKQEAPVVNITNEQIENASGLVKMEAMHGEVLSAMEADNQRALAFFEKIASNPPPSITINVPEQAAPQVTVNVPDQAAPVVNITNEKPEITINVPEQAAPVVNITNEKPEITINVPEQPAPIVNVQPPAPSRGARVIRDYDGKISSIEPE